jgi:hypothetical protein
MRSFRQRRGCAGRPSGFQGYFLVVKVLVAVEDRGELVSRLAGLQRSAGIEP